MKVAVCMKQVPATSEGNMDTKTGMLLRTGMEAIVNVYDLAALEAALQMKAVCGAQIHVFTMGPEKAEAVLREAFGMGADEGYLICGREFAGADVLATSYTLMQAIQSVGEYDLVLCGQQTTDGDTAQVSGALAKWMDIPHLNWVKQLKIAEERYIEAVYCMEGREVTAKVALPCLLSVERESFIPRMPSLKRKIAGRKKEIHRITIKDFEDKDRQHYGLNGSATRVKKIFPPQRTMHREVTALKKEEAVDYILNLLKPFIQEEKV